MLSHAVSSINDTPNVGTAADYKQESHPLELQSVHSVPSHYVQRLNRERLPSKLQSIAPAPITPRLMPNIAVNLFAGQKEKQLSHTVDHVSEGESKAYTLEGSSGGSTIEKRNSTIVSPFASHRLTHRSSSEGGISSLISSKGGLQKIMRQSSLDQDQFRNAANNNASTHDGAQGTPSQSTIPSSANYSNSNLVGLKSSGGKLRCLSITRTKGRNRIVPNTSLQRVSTSSNLSRSSKSLGGKVTSAPPPQTQLDSTNTTPPLQPTVSRNTNTVAQADTLNRSQCCNEESATYQPTSPVSSRQTQQINTPITTRTISSKSIKFTTARTLSRPNLNVRRASHNDIGSGTFSSKVTACGAHKVGSDKESNHDESEYDMHQGHPANAYARLPSNISTLKSPLITSEPSQCSSGTNTPKSPTLNLRQPLHSHQQPYSQPPHITSQSYRPVTRPYLQRGTGSYMQPILQLSENATEPLYNTLVQQKSSVEAEIARLSVTLTSIKEQLRRHSRTQAQMRTHVQEAKHLHNIGTAGTDASYVIAENSVLPQQSNGGLTDILGPLQFSANDPFMDNMNMNSSFGLATNADMLSVSTSMDVSMSNSHDTTESDDINQSALHISSRSDQIAVSGGRRTSSLECQSQISMSPETVLHDNVGDGSKTNLTRSDTMVDMCTEHLISQCASSTFLSLGEANQ
eukprot:CFRG0340T1